MNIHAQVAIKEYFNTPFDGAQRTAGDLVSTVTNTAIAIAGVTAVFLIVYNGFKLIQSAGNSDPKQAAQAREAVTYGIIGLIIVITAYWIVQFLELVITRGGSNVLN